MTKGNPLWETSYHSRVTIQRKLKKKKKAHEIGPPLLAREQHGTWRGRYSVLPIEVILQVAMVIVSESSFLVEVIFIARTPTEMSWSQGPVSALAPPWKGSVTAGMLKPQPESQPDTTLRTHTNVVLVYHRLPFYHTLYISKRTSADLEAPSHDFQMHQPKTPTKWLPWQSSGYDFSFQCKMCGFDPWLGN